ncbi:MAG: FkbM family methyltransferase [Victivallales bacterium]|nr:FkbM family methyltransferase [Victivallales bacterium]
MPNYYCALMKKINESYFNAYNDNYCEERYGPEKPNKNLDFMDAYAKNGFVHKSMVVHVQKTLEQLVEPNLQAFEAVYNLLADETSRKVMVDIMALLILGGRKVKILDMKEYITPELLADYEACSDPEDVLSIEGFELGDIRWCDLSKLPSVNSNVKIYSRPMSLMINFLIDQYACQRDDGKSIDVMPGDYVIDGGACWGDTAVHFAEKTGASGKVFSFEFIDDNIKVFERVLSGNPELKDRICLEPHPLWSVSGEELGMREHGPGSKVLLNADKDAKKAVTVAIDDFVDNKSIAKIDFIKMDIEGAELPALKGTEKTLRKYRPRLAICVYHNGYTDMLTVPLWLNSLGLGYKFYLKHATSYGEETVLFADTE